MDMPICDSQPDCHDSSSSNLASVEPKNVLDASTPVLIPPETGQPIYDYTEAVSFEGQVTAQCSSCSSRNSSSSSSSSAEPISGASGVGHRDDVSNKTISFLSSRNSEAGESKKPVAIISPIIIHPQQQQQKLQQQQQQQQQQQGQQEEQKPQQQQPSDAIDWCIPSAHRILQSVISQSATCFQLTSSSVAVALPEVKKCSSPLPVSRITFTDMELNDIWRESCALTTGRISARELEPHHTESSRTGREDLEDFACERSKESPTSAAQFFEVRNDLDPLSMSNFFYEHLGRSEVKATLRDSDVGTFLVRKSSDPLFECVLSIRTSTSVTSVRLARNSQGLIRLDCDPKQANQMPAYSSVLDLLESHVRDETGRQPTGNERVYLERAGHTDTVLDLKKAFERTPASLAHLCRRRVNGLVPRQLRAQLVEDMRYLGAKHKQVFREFLLEYPFRI